MPQISPMMWPILLLFLLILTMILVSGLSPLIAPSQKLKDNISSSCLKWKW